MKRVFCLLLCVLTLAGMLVGCGKEYAENIEIPVYISSEITNFDPAVAYTNHDAVQIMSMIYSGLYKYDEKGNVVADLVDKCTIEEDEEAGTYAMILTLKDTCWSDNIAVKSDDFVYAIRRILEPDFYCEAASMLYDLKNARLVKSGDMSIDDLGVYSIDSETLEFVFECKIDYEQFKEILCSPAFYPLREDYAAKEECWATCASTIICNGPFVVRTYEAGKSLTLERNIYYFRTIDEDDEDPITQSVIPYRINVNFRLNAKNNLKAYEEGEIVYNSGIDLDSRADYASTATVSDEYSTLTYFFNTNNELFSNASVRRALSMAIDRNEIVSLLTFAKPAEGLISYGVYETAKGTSFRDSTESLISASADLDGAKKLLKEAGVSGGEFTISIRDNAVSEKVANYVAGVWKKLGFSVTVVKLKQEELSEEESVYDNMYRDTYLEAYKSGDFDVIAVDYQMLSKYAFGSLAPFAKDFAGNSMDMTTGLYEVESHITGYNSEEYNELIEKAYLETNETERANILHKAEELLMNDMPVVPLVYYQNAYVMSSDLTGVTTNGFGLKNFARAELANYEKYIETETE